MTTAVFSRILRRHACSVPFLTCLAALVPGLSRHVAIADDAPAVNYGDYYGFGPLEIFKLEFRSHSMLAGDFNSDGRGDLAIVDNSHSRIDILLQREHPPEDGASTSQDVNRVDSHWRFEHTKLPVDREVDAMIAGDFNSDGKTDLAYFGDPDRLVVRYQTDGREWNEKWETRLADVTATTWSIATGDFNHDDRDDLVVLGDQSTYVLTQNAQGGFATPISIRNTAEELRLGMSGDFDGDGRDDLFYTATSDGERYICVRMQTAKGELGPEFRLDLKNSLGVSVYDMLGDGTEEILAISGQTERLGLYRAHRPKPGEEPESRPIQFGVGVKGSGKRDLDVGDLDGDGLADVVVSDPESAQLIVYRQQAGSGLDLGTSYASFLGVEQLRVQDLTGDGRAEVVVLSPKEKTIGLCRLDDDGARITFPQTLPIDDEVLTFEIADLNSDAVPEIVYMVKGPEEESGSKSRSRSSSTKFLLKALTYPTNGEMEPYLFGEDRTEVEVETRDVGRLTALDANADGRVDLLLTIDSSRAPTLLLTDEHGVPQPVTGGGGVQLTDLEAGAVFSGHLGDAPALLIAQGAFARRMELDADHRWQVLDQYNSGESTAKVKGSALLDLDGQPGEEIVLVDTGSGKLRMFRQQDELYRSWRTIDIGSFPFQSLKVADLNGDQREDLLLFGGNRFAVLYTGQTDPRLEELANYESQRDDAFLVDMSAGDLNGDGQPDLAVLDNESHTIEIVVVLPGDQADEPVRMYPAVNFKVFEEKSFHESGGGGLEPREMLISDVTGDGRADLILLTHDRILLYPQDTPSAQAQPAATQTGGE
ncbi:MAG: VCBS repeat-containing protein [Planctomycetaceae bacterium]|nr:VCBS repeat-containing protein [Planctomycetaceae bacterium]